MGRVAGQDRCQHACGSPSVLRHTKGPDKGNSLGEWGRDQAEERRGLKEECARKGVLGGKRRQPHKGHWAPTAAYHHHGGCLLHQNYVSKASKGLRSNHHMPVLPPLGISLAHEQITK